MADTQNTQITPESTSSPATAEQQNLNVSQTTPTSGQNNLNVSQTKQDMIADQKRRRELIVKQNSIGGLSPQEQEELNNLNKKFGRDSGKSSEIKQNNKLAKEPDKEIEEPKDIFKEEDILKYMYEEWLLGGANWLFKKTYKGVDWMAGKTAKGLWGAVGWAGSEVWSGMKKTAKDIPPLFKKDPPRDDAMTGFAAALNETHTQSMAAKANMITGHLEKFGSTLKRFSEGNISEEDKNTPLYKLYQKVPEDKRKDFCESMFTQAANATQNSLEIHRMAERLVSLRNMQSAMSNPNPQPISSEMYKKEVSLMALVVARSISQSRDPLKSMKNLDENIEKSEKRMQTAFVDGKYRVAGKNPEDNKKLNKQLAETFQSIGLQSNGLITQEKEQALQKYAYNDPNSKKTMLERLVVEQVAALGSNNKRNSLEAAMVPIKQRQEDHQKREAVNHPRIAAMFQALDVEHKYPGIVPNPNYSVVGQSPLRPEFHNTNSDYSVAGQSPLQPKFHKISPSRTGGQDR